MFPLFGWFVSGTKRVFWTIHKFPPSLSLFQSICIPTYMYVLSYIDIVKYYLTTYIKTRQPFKSPWLKSLISFHFIEVLSLLLLSSLERHPQSSFWYQFSARIRHPLKTAFPENCVSVSWLQISGKTASGSRVITFVTR